MARLDGWRLDGDGAELAIEKTYVLADFAASMAFVNAVAFIAQTHDHHPELSLSGCQCSVRWRTRDVGGITRLDLDLAARVDAVLTTLTA